MAALTFLAPKGLASARGYSHAVLTEGRLVHVAGQVALDAEGATVGVGDFAVQVERALANVEIAIGAAGLGFEAVAALTVYCAASVARDELVGLSASLRRRVGERSPPAVTLVFVDGLLDPAWLVEVQAVAVAAST